MMLLVEHLKPAEAQLVESVVDGKNLFLSGRMMVGEQVNGNGRIYPRDEISRAVKYFQTKIDEGNFIAGELNHPDNLTIDLKNVSHIITEIKMDGDVAYGKCKILNTPSGQIAKALIEGGMRLGVSSRGTGNVTNEGLVSDFQPVTVDIVANPSGPGVILMYYVSLKKIIRLFLWQKQFVKIKRHKNFSKKKWMHSLDLS